MGQAERTRFAQERSGGGVSSSRFSRRQGGSVLARGLPSFVERDEMPSVSGQRRADRNARQGSSRPGELRQQRKQTQPQGGQGTTIKYEVVKGPLVKFSDVLDSEQVPTAVLVHGILGSGKNLRSFARKLARENPAWQFLLVDLRCHGDSADVSFSQVSGHGNGNGDGLNSVDGAAADVLQLLKKLGLFPQMLIGHSFGGKVVMKMVDQFGSKALPRPVKVWVLDTVPGDVRTDPNVADHPSSLIDTLLKIPLPIRSPNVLVEQLRHEGFSFGVAAWVATNLTLDGSGTYTWTFDLNGIKEMYDSYENSDLWNVIERPPQGLSIDFVRAERSTFRWAGADHHRIESNGAQVHVLENAGHWVHTDNPEGLLRIMKSSFG